MSARAITFQFHPLVVSLSEERAGTCFHVEYTQHLAFKELTRTFDGLLVGRVQQGQIFILSNSRTDEKSVRYQLQLT